MIVEANERNVEWFLKMLQKMVHDLRSQMPRDTLFVFTTRNPMERNHVIAALLAHYQRKYGDIFNGKHVDLDCHLQHIDIVSLPELGIRVGFVCMDQGDVC